MANTHSHMYIKNYGTLPFIWIPLLTFDIKESDLIGVSNHKCTHKFLYCSLIMYHPMNPIIPKSNKRKFIYSSHLNFCFWSHFTVSMIMIERKIICGNCWSQGDWAWLYTPPVQYMFGRWFSTVIVNLFLGRWVIFLNMFLI